MAELPQESIDAQPPASSDGVSETDIRQRTPGHLSRMSQAVIEFASNPGLDPNLLKRDYRLFDLYSRGESYEDIGPKLGLSPSYVDKERQRIIKAIEALSNEDAIRILFKFGRLPEFDENETRAIPKIGDEDKALLTLIANRKTGEEIASYLNVATVMGYELVQQAVNNIGGVNRWHAVRLALEAGKIDPEATSVTVLRREVKPGDRPEALIKMGAEHLGESLSYEDMADLLDPKRLIDRTILIHSIRKIIASGSFKRKFAEQGHEFKKGRRTEENDSGKKVTVRVFIPQEYDPSTNEDPPEEEPEPLMDFEKLLKIAKPRRPSEVLENEELRKEVWRVMNRGDIPDYSSRVVVALRYGIYTPNTPHVHKQAVSITRGGITIAMEEVMSHVPEDQGWDAKTTARFLGETVREVLDVERKFLDNFGRHPANREMREMQQAIEWQIDAL